VFNESEYREIMASGRCHTPWALTRSLDGWYFGDVKRIGIVGAVLAAVLVAGAAVVVAAPGVPDEAAPGTGSPSFLDDPATYPPGIARHAEELGVLPPGLEKKLAGDWVPPGQAKKDGDWIPPGHAKKDGDWIPPGHAKKDGDWIPPGHARKGTFPPGLMRLGKIPPGWLVPN
jgi:hypothetical protein